MRRQHPIDGACLGMRIVELARAHRLRIETQLHQVGLHVGQELILFALWRAPGASLSPSELAAQLDVERPTITKALQRMERQGWIRRQPDPDDGRRWRILASAKADAHQQIIEQIWLDTECDLVAGLEPAEREAIAAAFDHMLANLMSP